MSTICSENRFTLQTFPQEILNIIYTFATPRSLVLFARTCSAVRNIIIHDNLLWNKYITKDLHLKLFPKWSPYEEYLRRKSYRCTECGDKPSRSHQLLTHVRVCGYCELLEDYAIMTATNAKKVFRLSEPDLVHLEMVMEAYTIPSQDLVRRYFLVSDLNEVSKKKLEAKGTTLKREWRKSSDIVAQRFLKSLAPGNPSTIELIEALNARGFTIGDDVKSCNLYVEDEWPFSSFESVDEVVDLVELQHLLNQHTPFKIIDSQNMYYKTICTDTLSELLLDHLLKKGVNYEDSIAPDAEPCTCGRTDQVTFSDWIEIVAVQREKKR